NSYCAISGLAFTARYFLVHEIWKKRSIISMVESQLFNFTKLHPKSTNQCILGVLRGPIHQGSSYWSMLK
ncbi:hypothetical protein, partial [Klebsiella pneumoniae]|uniref:hypothetical protein n=1 Tax=Klebsiella pneumoniae TaxID=573 RepID=UPI001D0E195F